MGRVLIWWVVSVTAVICSGPGICPVSASASETEALLAWAQRGLHGEYRMHFSRYDGRTWSAPFLLSDSTNEEILPAVASDDQGNFWVAWTELNGVYGLIRYSVFLDGAWGAPMTLKTGTISDLAPSLSVDADGVAWMVFSGSDGTQDDVYAVHWLGGSWSTPEKIHPDNRTPDILPRVVIDAGGAPVVEWQGFDGKQYRTFSRRKTVAGWSAVDRAARSHPAAAGSAADLNNEEARILNELPSFFQDPRQAVLHLRTDRKISIRLGGR